MGEKENIVILSLEEYNRMTTDIRTLCARNERLRASVDNVEILKTELCKLKKVEEYNIDLSEMYFKQKKVISRLKNKGLSRDCCAHC